MRIQFDIKNSRHFPIKPPTLDRFTFRITYGHLRKTFTPKGVYIGTFNLLRLMITYNVMVNVFLCKCVKCLNNQGLRGIYQVSG